MPSLGRAGYLPLPIATLHLGHLHPVPGAHPLARQRVAEAERVETQGRHGRILGAGQAVLASTFNCSTTRSLTATANDAPRRDRDVCAVDVCSLYESPVPGKLTVVRVPRGPMVNHAPRPPTDVLMPHRLKFKRKPRAGIAHYRSSR